MSSPAFSTTVSGQLIDINQPTPNDIRITDIAESLAKICRFNGHLQTHYSVAQHCVHFMELLPDEHKAYGLFHDAHEAYMGDITRPVKQALAHSRAGDTLKRMATKLDKAIFAAVGLSFPMSNDLKELIQHTDRVMLATEKRDLFLTGNWGGDLPKPASFSIRPWPWPKAMEKFLESYKTCCALNPKMQLAKNPLI